MVKKLSMRIAEEVGRKTPSRSGAYRAAFLAVRGDVKEALDKGWTVQSVWATLHKERKINFSYPTFCRFVRRLTPGRPLQMGSGKSPAVPPAGPVTDDPTSTGLPVFGSNSTPKKEDLI